MKRKKKICRIQQFKMSFIFSRFQFIVSSGKLKYENEIVWHGELFCELLEETEKMENREKKNGK